MPTRAKFKELAGDMPVSHYLRALAFGQIAPPASSAQHPIPGTSQNTIASVKAEVHEIAKAVQIIAVSMVRAIADEPRKARIAAEARNKAIDAWARATPGQLKLALDSLVIDLESLKVEDNKKSEGVLLSD